MPRILLAATLFLTLACSESTAPLPDGAPPGARVAGNCVMNPSMCPGGSCLSQDGVFYCVCTNVPAGQACEPCPSGYRYHGKSFSCVPTCETVAPTCKADEICEEWLGNSSCRPAPRDAAAQD